MDSEACSRKGVEVRFFSSAPILFGLRRDGKHGAVHLSLLFRHLKLRFNSCGTRHFIVITRMGFPLFVRAKRIHQCDNRTSVAIRA